MWTVKGGETVDHCGGEKELVRVPVGVDPEQLRVVRE